RHLLLERVEVGGHVDEAALVGGALLREADVLGDLEEPGRLELGRGSALEAAEGVQERGLGRVLGLLAVAEPVQAEGEDLATVPLVEQAGRLALGWPQTRANGCRMAFGRIQGHVSTSRAPAPKRSSRKPCAVREDLF